MPGVDEDRLARRHVELKVQELKQHCAANAPSQREIEVREAVTRGRLEQTRRLMAQPVDLANCHLHGSPIIVLAVATRKTNPAVVSLLLDRGADVNAVNVHGLTALHSAAMESHSAACARVLLDAGADVHARDLEGRTPLHWAAWSGLGDVVRALVAAGASTEVRCWGGVWVGKTPVDLASTETILQMLQSSRPPQSLNTS